MSHLSFERHDHDHYFPSIDTGSKLAVFIGKDLNISPPEAGKSQARPGAPSRERQRSLCYKRIGAKNTSGPVPGLGQGFWRSQDGCFAKGDIVRRLKAKSVRRMEVSIG